MTASDDKNRPNGLTYAASGVDIDAGDALVDRIKPLAKSTRRPGAAADLGGGSLELARVTGGALAGPGRTFPLCPLTLARLSPHEVVTEIDRALQGPSLIPI